MNNKFEEKIKPILTYLGIITATLASIAYIGLVLVLIFGFNVDKQPMEDILLYSIINSLFGLIISLSISWNGQLFAKNLAENQDVIKEYYSKPNKKKKHNSLSWYWFIKILISIFTKGIMICFSTFAIIYIVVQASNDYSYLLLALVSLILFIGFGLIGLVNAYENYNNNFVPYMKEKIDERKANKTLEMAKENCNQQRNDSMDSNSRNNILDGSICDRTIGDNNKSVVLDSVRECICNTSNVTASNANTVCNSNISKNNI